MAKCRICDIEIDKEKDDWVKPVTNWYYHRKCYQDWKEATPATDEEYKAYIYDFISRDLKVSYNYHMCEAQRKKFIKEHKMTNKGIFFALKYFYEIKKGDWDKGHGGFGIIPYIYNESCTYWALREKDSAGVVNEIEYQMRAAAERKTKTIKKQDIKPRKFTVDFSALDELEDDE